MLVREQNTVIEAVVGGWNKVSAAISDRNKARKESIWDRFFATDTRVLSLSYEECRMAIRTFTIALAEA